MKRIVRIFSQARNDVDRIFDWLRQRSPQGAATWYAAFVRAVGKIEANPESHSVIAESVTRWNRTIHQILFKTPSGRRYRIVFELTSEEIRILRVRGPGQSPLRRRDLPRD